ncbi:MAG: ABC transporter substrate-binding protein [Burkholderiales bacterium]
MSGLLKCTLLGLLLTLAIGGCQKAETPPQPQAEKLILQLHWIPDAHQLGFWLAIDKGFYREHGLDVTINPGGLDANPIKDVVSGSADLGQVGGIEQACTAVSEGLPVKAIASIHRETPHALISLSSKPIEKPADLPGKTIAVAYGDTAELLLKAYMAEARVTDSTVRLVPYKFDLTPLLAGKVDAVTGFSTGQPATIEKLGRRPVVLAYSSLGISSYGYTIISSETTIAKKSGAIRRFLTASRKGWEYAFSHPDEAVALFKNRFGDIVDEKLTRRELDLIKNLMLDATGKLATWKLDEGRVKSVIGYLERQGQLKKAPPVPTSVFTNAFTE